MQLWRKNLDEIDENKQEQESRVLWESPIRTRLLLHFLMIPEISLCGISCVTTKAPCGVALTHERHMRIEISDFVMRTFVVMWERHNRAAICRKNGKSI